MSTHRERIESLSRTIDRVRGKLDSGDLRGAVDEALRTPEPAGDPELIGSLAWTTAMASAKIADVRKAVGGVADRELPAAWTGRVGETAVEAVHASGNDLERMADAYEKAGKRLYELGEALAGAKRQHSTGTGPLSRAADLLTELADLLERDEWDDDKLNRAKAEAQQGIGTMLDAARKAEEAGHRAAAELNDLASRAEAVRLKADGLSAVDRLVLTDATAVAGGDEDGNRILNPNEAVRAGQALDRLNPADRQRMDRLLAESGSPQERAYLMKALAAGHSVDEVAAFDQQIHAHSEDPEWLRQRLSPLQIDASPPVAGIRNYQPVAYQDVEWGQGPHQTCVASSTVMARAAADPLYALRITTGGHPGDPQYDNRDAFAARLREEQRRVYDDGRGFWKNHFWSGDGMTDDEARDAMNDEVRPSTGTEYRNVGLDGEDARRDVLVDVEKAVDEGKPVEFSIRGGGEGHGMLVVGHQGDLLQVYNPWGYTVWITEDDFVHNRMDNALTSPSGMNTVTSVRLPK